MEPLFQHGDDVNIVDKYGYPKIRGTVMGTARTSWEPQYDIQPIGTKELTERVRAFEHEICRVKTGAVEKMVKAYSKGIASDPKNILDEA